MIDPSEIKELSLAFASSLARMLRNEGVIPVAYAVLTGRFLSADAVEFRIFVGSNETILPKGSGDAAQGLYEFLDAWQRENYPDAEGVCHVSQSELH